MQALWMVVGSFLFAVMAVCVKFASAWFNPAELVFYRGLIGMVVIWLVARSQRVTMATRYPAMHAWRSLVGVLSLWLWFYSIGELPLATAVTLNYTSSVWVAAFLVGAALLAWSPSRGADSPRQAPLMVSVLVGFAGVILVLRPTIDQNQLFAAFIGLLSGLTAAFVYLEIVALGRVGEPASRTVFYFAATSALAGAVAMAVGGWSPWDWVHALWLLPVGLLASLAQLCMTRAYNDGATMAAASLQYSGVLFGAIFGVVLFGETLSLSGWTGMALIVFSGIGATVLRSRAAPGAPPEEH